MKKKRKLRLRRKLIPFPVLIFLLPAYFEFLYGEDDAVRGILFMYALFLVLYYFLGPDLDAPSSPGVIRGRLVDPAFLPPMNAKGAMQTVQFRLWSKRLYEDRNYRSGVLALVMAVLLIGTALFTCFNDEVIRRRANSLIALCALGLLILAVLAVVRKLRKKEKPDSVVFPTPQVNMTYDHDAAADSRVRALQQRLERLEGWKNSGLIDKEEYEELRKKYLGK